MATNRRDPEAVGQQHRTRRAAQWTVAIVVPVSVGGVVGGPVGGCVTAVLIIPWIDHLLRRGAPRPHDSGPVSARRAPVTEIERRSHATQAERLAPGRAA